MSYIGICEYVIGIIHDKDIWYYVGDKDSDGKRIRSDERYSSFLVDAKRYDDEDILREELESLPKTLTYKILELQRCPKCKKEFTEHPALSREDNETEICPECGIREALQVFIKNEPRQMGSFLVGLFPVRFQDLSIEASALINSFFRELFVWLKR